MSTVLKKSVTTAEPQATQKATTKYSVKYQNETFSVVKYKVKGKVTPKQAHVALRGPGD
jgi:hypothetical protein